MNTSYLEMDRDDQFPLPVPSFCCGREGGVVLVSSMFVASPLTLIQFTFHLIQDILLYCFNVILSYTHFIIKVTGKQATTRINTRQNVTVLQPTMHNDTKFIAIPLLRLHPLDGLKCRHAIANILPHFDL
jgi:hypothetical protein